MILRLQITYKTPVLYNNILFSVQTLFVTFFKLRTIQHTIQYRTVQYSTVQRSACKVPLLLSDFSENLF